MSEVTWLQVVAIAAIAQLAVLPGEKVQFIIAGLSTRFHPLLVVSAAGTAFAGWTALEIAVGSALTDVVPGSVLDAGTAVLYVLFAVMLVRSAPERGSTDHGEDLSADGGIDAAKELEVTIPGTERTVPNSLGGFLPVFALMAMGEFGDKTQMVTFSLAAQFPAHPTAIWSGEMLAIIPVSLLNAYAFNKFSHRFDRRRAHFAGAVLFGFFAADFAAQVLFGVSVWETMIRTVAMSLGS